MNPNEREKLMMAYLDGQMSATEASAFDEHMTDAERERLSAETRLDAGIADALCGRVPCPDALWRRTQQQLRQHGARGRGRWFKPWTVTLLAAAGLLVAAGLHFGPRGEEGLTAAPSRNLKAFAETSQVAANPAAVDAFLHAHGMPVHLAEFEAVHPESHHYTTLLGAREERDGGGTTVALLYDCCGFPVKVLVAPEASAAGRVLANTPVQGSFQATASTQGQRIALVSHHPSAELLDVVQPGETPA